MTDGSGLAHTPDFDRHVAEFQKAEGQLMKQERLAREELDHLGAASSSSGAATAAAASGTTPAAGQGKRARANAKKAAAGAAGPR